MTSKAGQLSRRNLVLGGAAIAAGGAYAAGATPLGSSWFRTVQKTGANVLGIELTPHGGIAHWQSMVGQEFYVETPSGTLQTKLVSVEALHDGGKGRPLGLAMRRSCVRARRSTSTAVQRTTARSGSSAAPAATPSPAASSGT
jgi:hypothetical protein